MELWRTVTWRSLALTVFLPVALYEVGNGAITPIVAVSALELGAPAGLAALIAALPGLGQIAGNVPAARIARRFGERRTMIIAAGLAVLALISCALLRSLPVLAVALLLVGLCNSAYYLARQAYLTDAAPLEIRARAMSTLGGSHRIGQLIGPFAGAAAIGALGIRGAFAIAACAAAAAGLMLIMVNVVLIRVESGPRDRHHAPGPEESPSSVAVQRPSLAQVFAGQRRLLLSLGAMMLLVRAVQTSRPPLLQLWAHHLGVEPGTISLLFGVAGAAEVAVFYPAGRLMDRYGRLIVGLPSILIISIALLLLPLTGGLIGLGVLVAFAGLGQGLGAGLFFTLAADTAPTEGRHEFLAVWRLFSDSGTAGGPLLVAAVVTGSAVAPAALVVGAIGVVAAAAQARFVPRYSAYATPAAIRRITGP